MKTIKKTVPFLMVALIILTLVGCSSPKSSTSFDKKPLNNATQTQKFPNFKGTDFEGQSVDETIFNKNKVTVLNFWFNGCSACVNEMPALEDFNKELQKKDSEIIGVNVEASENDELLAEAKEILKKQNITFRNIIITGGEEANKYLSGIMAFPTTILVDKNGNIIGKPITGNIDSNKTMQDILKQVDQVDSNQ